MGLFQSVNGLNRTKTDLPLVRNNSVSILPFYLNCNFSLLFQPASLLHQILDSPNLYNHMSQSPQFLKSLSLSVSLSLSYIISCYFCGWYISLWIFLCTYNNTPTFIKWDHEGNENEITISKECLHPHFCDYSWVWAISHYFHYVH